MIYSTLSKALVPAVLLFTQSTLAQESCSKKDATLTFFGMGSAGVYTKFKCAGPSQVNEASRTASVGEDAPRVASGMSDQE